MKTSLFALVLCLLFSGSVLAKGKKEEAKNPLRILVFSKTSGYRHASISSGMKMLYDQSKKQNWLITATEDASLFNKTVLENIDVLVFLNPTGDTFNEQQQKQFETFMDKGKGFVGIHAASDCEFDWPYFGNLVGAYFASHPPAQEATVNIESTDHPAMKPFEGMKTYTTFDEWYAFRSNPREKVNVLASLDESSIKKTGNDKWRMGDHPLIWYTEKNNTRSFYTVFGHTHESFQNKLVIEHITNAINWAGKRID